MSQVTGSSPLTYNQASEISIQITRDGFSVISPLVMGGDVDVFCGELNVEMLNEAILRYGEPCRVVFNTPTVSLVPDAMVEACDDLQHLALAGFLGCDMAFSNRHSSYPYCAVWGLSGYQVSVLQGVQLECEFLHPLQIALGLYVEVSDRVVVCSDNGIAHIVVFAGFQLQGYLSFECHTPQDMLYFIKKMTQKLDYMPPLFFEGDFSGETIALMRNYFDDITVSIHRGIF